MRIRTQVLGRGDLILTSDMDRVASCFKKALRSEEPDCAGV